jgi:hypothetical protein
LTMSKNCPTLLLTIHMHVCADNNVSHHRVPRTLY